MVGNGLGRNSGGKVTIMKVLLATFVCALLVCALCAAQADTFNFSTNGLGDLDHNSYYSWGINTSTLEANLLQGYTIQSATLYIDNINNWTKETTDRLYIRLLDNPAIGVKTWSDNQTTYDQWKWVSGDSNHMKMSTYGTTRPLIQYYDGSYHDYYHDGDGSYGDPSKSPHPAGTNLVYSFGNLTYNGKSLLQYLNDFATDGKVGFGFDPDCHYFNDGVRFEITTCKNPVPGRAVPEPISVFLGTLGMGTIAAVRRIRRS